MDTIFTFLVDHLFELLMGGGLIGWYMASENKRAVKIDNDKKLLDECYQHIERMNRDIKDMREHYEGLIRQKDNEILKLNQRLHEAETEINSLKEELDSMRSRRAANGRFVKKQKNEEVNTQD